MKFSYRVNERMYLEAFNLRFWKLRVKVIFGVLVVIALLEILILSLAILEGLSTGIGLLQTIQGDSQRSSLLLLILIFFVAGFVLLFPRWRVSRIYRRNPARDGIFTASATPEHLEVTLEATGASCFKWSFYKYWKEGKNVIILATHSGQCQVLPKAGLSDAQQNELRGILAAALPKN